MTLQCTFCGTINITTARFCKQSGKQLGEVAASKGIARNFSAPPLAIGTVLQKRYKVIRPVAQGGQGTIYQALDERTGRQFALKAIRLDAVSSPEDYTDAVERIAQEARMLGQLSHPNIVQVVDFFEENQLPYVVMEYIDGNTLEQLMTNEGGYLSEPQVVFLARQLCSALNYLHLREVPIIFRDLKPDNVMVDKYQTVKMIDFGIARKFKPGSKSDTQQFGSIGYAAPEAFGNKQTDVRSDVFSLGVMLHRLCTGYDPTANPWGPLPLVGQLRPELSSGLEEVISRATQRSPEQRWQSVAELERSLGHLHSEPTRFFANSARRDMGNQGLDTHRPTTRLLLRLNRFSTKQVFGALAIAVFISSVLILLLGPLLYSYLQAVPFLCFTTPLIFAALRKSVWIGVLHIFTATFLSLLTQYSALGAERAADMFSGVLLGALLSGLAVLIASTWLLSHGLARRLREKLWIGELLGCVIVGFTIYLLFYPLAFGPDSIVFWLYEHFKSLWQIIGLPEIKLPASWLITIVSAALAPILGGIGWFVGDLIQQSNQTRRLAATLRLNK